MRQVAAKPADMGMPTVPVFRLRTVGRKTKSSLFRYFLGLQCLPVIKKEIKHNFEERRGRECTPLPETVKKETVPLLQ